jgi:NADH dehydrogenase
VTTDEAAVASSELSSPPLNVVTGAFGYTGKYITRRLLALGQSVRTLTGHPDPSPSAPPGRGRGNPFGSQVEVRPFNFDNPSALTESLRGATTLYNTYWIRFARGDITFDRAVANSRTLIQAAATAGVRKIVQISITNPSKDSPLPYFRGKAAVEQCLMASGLPYAIIRPTVVFGMEDILLNNIAWLLRRFPIFPVAGEGDYRVQPVFVEDLAELAVDAAQGAGNAVLDAAGPEVYTFDEQVRLIAQAVGSRARVVHLPPGLVLPLSRLMGLLMRDVVLTSDELAGLMADLLVSTGPPTGHTSFRGWLEQNRGQIGAAYTSELRRHYR